MILKFNNLTKIFGDKVAVKNLNIQLNFGIYGLLGPNGAGKSTIMRMCCGILDPSRGSIYLDNKSIQNMGEEYRELLGYLPQNFGYYPDLTGNEFMNYIGIIKGLSKQVIKERTSQLIELVGLEKELNQKIRTYSVGMKQRLGIAQSIMNDPQIIIMDEPTAGLDPKEKVRFHNLISDLAKDKIVLLSTHVVGDIEYIADLILMLKEGQIIANDSPEDAYMAQFYDTLNGEREES